MGFVTVSAEAKRKDGYILNLACFLFLVFSSSHKKQQTLSLSSDKRGTIGDLHVCQHKQDQMIAQQEEATGNPMIFD